MTTVRTESAEGIASPSVFAREELLDHAKRPRNRGVMPDADATQEEANPLCGDVVTVYVKYGGEAADGGGATRVERMTFTGHGCIISQAAASVLTEHVVGKSLKETQRLGRREMEQLLGGSLSPSRVTCAMLPLVALQGIPSRRSHS